MKVISGILIGFLAFFLFASLLSKLFEKSPEELAEEKCKEIQKVSRALSLDSVPATVVIDGKTYQCDWNGYNY